MGEAEHGGEAASHRPSIVPVSRASLHDDLCDTLTKCLVKRS